MRSTCGSILKVELKHLLIDWMWSVRGRKGWLLGF